MEYILSAQSCSFMLYVGTKELLKRITFEELIEGRVTI